MQYPNVYKLAAGAHQIPCPPSVLGIYADQNIDIDWRCNGTAGPIARGVKVWEPFAAFEPLGTSYLLFTCTTETNVTIRAVQ